MMLKPVRVNSVAIFVESSLILAFIRYKNDKNMFEKALVIISDKKYYSDANTDKISQLIKDFVGSFTLAQDHELFKRFEQLIFELQTKVSSKYYGSFSELFHSIFALDGREYELDPLYQIYHKRFNFLDTVKNSPMLDLEFDRFYEYIEALVIYASVDNNNFMLHQNEAILILNEIKSYLAHNEDIALNANEIFFSIINIARQNCKNHLSTRFEGVVKANLIAMDDEQDAYFLNKLREIAASDGVHSTQEKQFDLFIEDSIKKVAVYEKNENYLVELLKDLASQPIPFKYSKNSTIIKSDNSINTLFKEVEKAMLHYYNTLGLIRIDKKNLYYIYSKNLLDTQQFNYLSKLLDLVTMEKYYKEKHKEIFNAQKALEDIFLYFQK